MIKRIKSSIRAKLTLIFIGILSISCLVTFAVVSIFNVSNLINIYKELSFIDEITFVIIFTCIVFSIVGSILMFFISKIISQPIEYIGGKIKEVSSGNFEVSIDYESQDEIGLLVKNFNIMTKELRGMEYLRKDFMSNVSHEFKTPIASIQGFVQMLNHKEISSEKRDEYIHIIIEETERLSHLTSNMLRISRLDNQTISNKEDEFSLDEQIRKTILLLENKFNNKKLNLDINLDKVNFKGNEELIQQVWVNLIDNAIKFSNAYGTLTVNLKKDYNKIKVEISDTGIGMNEESKNRLFEKFYQGDRSHSKEGNGLGLAIVKRIIEICNGDIKVNSELGKGTTFVVMLPSL